MYVILWNIFSNIDRNRRCIVQLIELWWHHGMATASTLASQIAAFMGPTWGPPGDDMTQAGLMLAPWALLSGNLYTGIPTGTGGFHSHGASNAEHWYILESLDKPLSRQSDCRWFEATRSSRDVIVMRLNYCASEKGDFAMTFHEFKKAGRVIIHIQAIYGQRYGYLYNTCQWFITRRFHHFMLKMSLKLRGCHHTRSIFIQ